MPSTEPSKAGFDPGGAGATRGQVKAGAPPGEMRRTGRTRMAEETARASEPGAPALVPDAPVAGGGPAVPAQPAARLRLISIALAVLGAAVPLVIMCTERRYRFS